MAENRNANAQSGKGSDKHDVPHNRLLNKLQPHSKLLNKLQPHSRLLRNLRHRRLFNPLK